MTRRHIALTALLAAASLAAPGAAQAKQIDALTVCGADGCGHADRAIGQALHDLGGAPLATAPRAAAHFRLVLHMGDGRRTFGTFSLVYVPRARALGGDGGWTRIDAGTAAKLAQAVAARPALPARDLGRTAAAVGAPGTFPAATVAQSPTSRPAPSGDASGAWWLLGAGAVATIGAFSVLGMRRRRRGRLEIA